MDFSSSMAVRRVKRRALFEKKTVIAALKQAFIMLRPDIQWKNPVMFVVEIGAFLILLFILQMLGSKEKAVELMGYFIALDIWLFFNVIICKFSDGIGRSARQSAGRFA